MTDETPTRPALSPAQQARLDALRRGGAAARTVAATGRRRAPLSAGQERIWFLNRFLPGEVVYTIAGSYQVAGNLSVAALRRALDVLTVRHEALRTRFEATADGPVQVVDDTAAVPLTRKTVAPGDIDAVLTRFAREPFDLATGPLLRVLLAETGPDEAVLAIVVHHIIADGWSLGVFVRELTTLYAAHLHGGAADLPAIPVSYLDYALWQRERTADGRHGRDVEYWRGALGGVPRVIELPTSRPRPAVQSFRGARLEFTVPADLTRAVERLARSYGATPYMALLAGYYAALHRWSGQSIISCATPVANRSIVETENVIGFFVNTVVLTADLTGQPAFAALLAQVRDRCLAGFAHQDVPFEQLVSALAAERELSHNPLAQVMFILQSAPAPPMELPGVTLTPRPVHTATAKFDVTVELIPAAEGLRGVVEYATDLFDPAVIYRFAGHYVQLLRAMVTDPGQRVAVTPMLTVRERDELATWNATDRDTRSGTTVPQWIAEQVERRPDQAALVGDGVELTYRELSDQVGRVANLLRTNGTGPDGLVGLCLDRGPEMVFGLLGALVAGGGYVPFDPRQPAERTARMIGDSGTDLVLTVRSGRAALADVPAGVRVIVLDDPAVRAALAAGRGTWPPVPTGEHNLAYVMHTSGSTGAPKGVMVEHRSIVNRISWMQDEYGLRPGDRVLQKTTYTFDVSVWEFLWPLMHGATMVLAAPDAHLDPTVLLDQIRRYGVTHLHFVPAVLAGVLAGGSFAGTQVARVFCSGEALPAELCERLYADCGVAVDNLYGPTECAVDVTSWAWRPGFAGPPPIGRPVANTRAHVVDAAGNELPVGVAGELLVGGIQVARGYANRPGLTAERFRPDPFSGRAGERVYHTGDIVRRRTDGTLSYLGRLDDQIKLRGIRIELGEVEAAVREDPVVSDAAVVFRDGQLIAYVTAGGRAPAADHAPGAGPVEEWVDEWSDRFARAYGDGPDPVDRAPNLKGWVSSYTREPIPDGDMAQWLDAVLERIRSTGARRVLEIGCGTGLLLLDLAGEVERYVGTDIAQEGLEYIGRELRRRGLTGQVELHRLAAHEIATLAPQRFDCVVLNSVIQYFPGREYLDAVLRAAAGLLHPGGVIFIGDVRNLAVLELFELSVVSNRDPEADPAVLRERAERRAAEEVELIVDPAYFTGLAGRLPGLGFVQTSVKTGAADNELTTYRYDVLLGLGRPATRVTRHHDWDGDLARLAAIAASAREDCVRVDGIPNGRMPGSAGTHPRDLVDIAARHGVGVHLTWSSAGAAEGRIAATFHPCGAGPIATEHRTGGPVVNDPARGAAIRALPHRVRQRLREVLPAYMVPAAVVVLPRLPLSSTGKVDRAALRTRPPDRRPDPGGTAELTPTGKLVAEIWREVLNVDTVGPEDNFFDLGGDSISSTLVAARLRAAGHPVMIRSIFANQSVARLAEFLEMQQTVAGATARDRPVPPPRAEVGYPLSALQEHMTSVPTRPASGVYVVQRVVRLRGTVDIPRVRSAWRDVVAATPFLRTVLRPDPATGALRQQVRATPDPAVADLDWSGRPGAEQVELMRRFLAGDRARGFDVAAEPPTRLAFVRTGADRGCWVISMDYRRLDGWSFPIYLGRFLARYAGAAGVDGDFDYGAYVTWRRDRLATGVVERWWRDRLPLLAHVPVTAPDRYTAGAFHAVRTRVPPGAVSRVTDAARVCGATLAATLQALWGALVQHLDGCPVPQFGVTTSGRSPEIDGIETALGMFMNTLPVRWPAGPDDLVRHWVAGAGGALLDLLDNDVIGLHQLTAMAGVPAGYALFDSYFVYQNTPGLADEESTVEGFEIVDEAPAAYAQQEHRLRVDVYPAGDGSLDLLLSGYGPVGPLADRLGRLRDLVVNLSSDLVDASMARLLAMPAPAAAPSIVDVDDHVAAMVTGGRPAHLTEVPR